MPKLIAEFQIELSGHCLVSLPDSENLSFEVEIKGFEVTIQLLTHPRVVKRGEEKFINTIERIILRVGRIEHEIPPELPERADGVRDYTIQELYFSKRVERYRAIACEALNRVIRFFKFQLHTPFLEEFHQRTNALGKPKWMDGSGQEVGKGGMIFFVEKIPGLWGELGVRSLVEGDIPNFQLALKSSGEPKIYDQILAGAREAIFESNLRRAVVELAMACEILVKECFFSGKIPALVAIGNLEDRGKVQLRVLDLIDQVAVEVFGNSFRGEGISHFQHIDHLFRCRNKVVHKGKLAYRKDTGKEETPNEKTLRSWWESVVKLEVWIKQLPTA